MEANPYLIPIVGGLLIGISAMGLYATLGRIAGVSGIVWGLMAGPGRDWRGLFVAGLIAGAALAHVVTGIPIPKAPDGPLWLAIVAGLLVGVGTRTGSGCTSGHGVCGIGRLSERSIVATVTFMTAGVLTVFTMRHLIGGVS